MVDIAFFRKEALSLPLVTEEPHFDKISFRYKGKIFATWWEKENRAMVRFTPELQSVFCAMASKIFFPVHGTWGQQGATFVDLGKVKQVMFSDALKQAYEGVAKKKQK